MRYRSVGLVSLAATALILAACDSGDDEAEDTEPVAAEATPVEAADAPLVETDTDGEAVRDIFGGDPP